MRQGKRMAFNPGDGFGEDAESVRFEDMEQRYLRDLGDVEREPLDAKERLRGVLEDRAADFRSRNWRAAQPAEKRPQGRPRKCPHPDEVHKTRRRGGWYCPECNYESFRRYMEREQARRQERSER